MKTLKLILSWNKYSAMLWAGFGWSRIHCNEDYNGASGCREQGDFVVKEMTTGIQGTRVRGQHYWDQ